MKKVRVFFASAACIAAVVGTYAKAKNIVTGTAFFIPTYYTAVEGDATPKCSIVISGICKETLTTRCTMPSYSYPQGLVTNVKISKILPNTSACVVATKNYQQ